MATNLPTYLLNANSVSARSAQVPNADFSGGMNKGGSNAPGIGINTGNIDPKLDNWSVLDQAGDIRNPQDSQHIGGDGLTDGGQAKSAINVIQGADVNDSVSFIVAVVQAAPGAGFGVAGADPINRTGATIEIGDRAWGTNTIA